MHSEKTPRSFILALAQMRVEGGRPEQNRRRALAMIARSARSGAELVLLPETMDLGWTFPKARDRAQPIPGGTFYQSLRRAARRHNIYVCAGLTEKRGANVYNAAVLISPLGKLLLHHRKLNELPIARDAYDQGDRLAVSHTSLGILGLMICADARADGECITRALGMMGAEVVLSPSAWAVPPDWNETRQRYGGEWVESYDKVARDYRMWIAGCSNVGRIKNGPWNDYMCIGNSLVVDPDGMPVRRGSFGKAAEELLFVRVTPERSPVRDDGWRGNRQSMRPGVPVISP